MRISDWSSDVCSSDLHCRVGPGGPAGGTSAGGGAGLPGGRTARADRRRQARGDRRHADRRPQRPDNLAGGRRNLAFTVRPERPAADRQSGVEGKSVSVRLDLGGRRVLKKKKTQK